MTTRKVAAITEQMCGFEVSSSQVSKATAELDEQLQAWRERPLGRMRYLYLDARYEKVRQCRLSCTGRMVHPGYSYYICRGRTDTLRAAQGERCTARTVYAHIPAT